VSTSSETLPEIFEFERFSTTVANAVLSPLVTGYVERLEQRLADGGYAGDLLILHSGGGVMTGKLVRRFAGRIAASGIAAGAIACRHIAGLCGFENAIGLDMGGTSTDISLVYEGEMRTTNEWGVEYGHPICFPSIEILTIGAGGGSLAWIDPAGSLRNGPQSAGADPGPACYRRGGEEPTNTDANVVLGRLGGELVGGAVELDVDAAADAVGALGGQLGLDATDTARAIVRVANANMADAVRLISIRRGYDPREFALVVFGGAGALHGAALAKELGIPTVLVPPNPGITSALGCLLVDIRHDLSEMYLRRVEDASPEEIDAEFRTLEDEGRARLEAEGVPEDRMSFQRTIAMRYLGQWRSLAVEIPEGPVDIAALVASFHSEHEREFAYAREDDAPVEIYQLALRAVGVTPKPELTRHEPEPDAPLPEPVARRPVHFDEDEHALDTPVFDRDTLRAGTRLEGPAIVQQLDSTVVVPPGVTAEVDPHLIIRMTLAEEELA
jgi:N-methylhydantoinase A